MFLRTAARLCLALVFSGLVLARPAPAHADTGQIAQLIAARLAEIEASVAQGDRLTQEQVATVLAYYTGKQAGEAAVLNAAAYIAAGGVIALETTVAIALTYYLADAYYEIYENTQEYLEGFEDPDAEWDETWEDLWEENTYLENWCSFYGLC